MTASKTQPWMVGGLPVASADQKAGEACGVDYGVKKGDVAVVDGTAANVKPTKKNQPWKAAWPPAQEQRSATAPSEACGVEYGLQKGDFAVVDGTAANVKPVKPLKPVKEQE